jgi:hypothetical protein
LLAATSLTALMLGAGVTLAPTASAAPGQCTAKVGKGTKGGGSVSAKCRAYPGLALYLYRAVATCKKVGGTATVTVRGPWVPTPPTLTVYGPSSTATCPASYNPSSSGVDTAPF